MSAPMPKRKLLTAKDVFDAIYEHDEIQDDSSGDSEPTEDNLLSDIIPVDHILVEQQESSQVSECMSDGSDGENSIKLTNDGLHLTNDDLPNNDVGLNLTDDGENDLHLTNDATARQDSNSGDVEVDETLTTSKKKYRKVQRALGKPYVSSNGKLIPERNLGRPCHCKNINCKDVELSEDDRQAIFKGYYAMADKDVQRAYLFGQIIRKPIKRRYVKTITTQSKSQRDHTFQYIIKLKDGTPLPVCKKAFASIHGIKFGTINYICDQIKKSATPLVDARGKHNNRPNKISEDDTNLVKEHINAFPKYQSHYSRKKNPNKVYISPDMNVAKLHRLYETWCKERRIKAVKYHKYLQIFSSEFNIGFGAPKSDTCKVCDEFRMKVNGAKTNPERSKTSAEWELHLRQADAGYTNLREDASKAVQNEKVIAFDLQQALPSPVIPTGIVFYLRQLWTYNLCIHDCTDNNANMYLWSEDVAARGSAEIASCLMNFFEALDDIKSITAYSDNCAGQNKNFSVVSLFWSMIVSGKFSRIDHKFLISGHTFLPCDRDFGLIEKVKRKREYIFLPSDWIEIIHSARTISPFKVIPMNQTKFFDVENSISNLVNRKVTTDGEKVKFSEIRWFRYDKSLNSDGYSFKYTYSELEPWKKVNISRRGREVVINKKPKYTQPRSINPKKIVDLMKLIPFLPESAKLFYRSLKASQEELNDIEILDSDD